MKDTYQFSNGKTVKKWHRVLINHAMNYGLTRRQAREAIQINPYLKKHENDLEDVFNETHFVVNEWFTPDYKEDKRNLDYYKKAMEECSK